MKDACGCLVCRKPHRSNDHHTREEVTKPINKLKSCHATSFLTSEDVSFIDGIFTGEGSQSNDAHEDEHEEHEGKWVGNPDQY